MKIYTDGACKGNPGKSGVGIIVYNGESVRRFAGKYNENGTNNIAELEALYAGLTILNKVNNNIEIFSDSQYAINSITKWAYSWKEKNWTKKGGPIKNLELIKKAHELYDKNKNLVKITYVKGHSGIKGNEEADSLANKAINEKITGFKEL
jgi:ribonuclease HI